MKTICLRWAADTKESKPLSTYFAAIADWADRNVVPLNLGWWSWVPDHIKPSPIMHDTPRDWQALHVNMVPGGTHEEGNGARLVVDGATGDLVITGMKASGLGTPDEPRFHRHVLTILHELIHAYDAAGEGHHLLTFEHPEVGWDWRDSARLDTGGIFARNPGLRRDPAVMTQGDVTTATISEFHRELIARNNRAPWGWRERGWPPYTDDNLCEVTLGGKRYRLGVERHNRRIVWTAEPGRGVYDISEFLLAELLTGKREITPTAWRPAPIEEFPPAPFAPPAELVEPEHRHEEPETTVEEPTPGQPEPASELDALKLRVAELERQVRELAVGMEATAKAGLRVINTLRSV